MRGRGIAITSAAVVIALVLGALLSPPPADAVAKEIIQLQQQVAILMQNQQSMQNEMTQNFAVLKTLMGQTMDSQNQLAGTVGSLQKTVQGMQANNGSEINTMSSQVQAISGTLEDLQARVGKLSDQLATAQNSLQSLDAKVTALGPPQQQTPGGPAGDLTAPPGQPGQPGSDAPAASNAPGASAPAPPADLLYTNALRDFTSGNYSLANQEFRQYLQYYPQTDLVSNAYFYLGEIAYAQGRYPDAIGEYNQVLNKYPHSFKRADARLKKAYALLKLKENGPAIAELRLVIRENPGTEQARRATAQLRELGVRTR